MATPLDLLLDEEGTYGINRPAASDAGKVVVATADGNHEFIDADTLITLDSGQISVIEDALEARQSATVNLSIAPGGGSGTNGVYLASDFAGALAVSSDRKQVILTVSAPGVVQIAGFPEADGRDITFHLSVSSAGVVEFLSDSPLEVTSTNRFALSDRDPYRLQGFGCNARFRYWASRWQLAYNRERKTDRVVELVDEFFSAEGELNWELGGVGTPTRTQIEGTLQSAVGNTEVRTSSSSSDTAFLRGGTVFAQYVEQMSWYVALTNITDVRIELGFGRDVTALNFGDSCVGFRFDPSVSANWRTVTRDAAVETTKVSSVPVVADEQFKLTVLQRNAGSVDFYINDQLAVTTHTTNVPSGGSNWQRFGLRIQTNTGAERVVEVDRFHAVMDFGSSVRYE